jgi:hypothetical protein
MSFPMQGGKGNRRLTVSLSWPDPYHLKHFYIPVLFVMSYIGFNMAWFYLKGEVLYGLLDYRNVFGTTIAVLAIMLLLFPVIHIVLWRWELAWFARYPADGKSRSAKPPW